MDQDSRAHAIRIAIVGAGPAGLLLANLLLHGQHQKNHSGRVHVDITIMEADASPTARSEYGSDLDLQPDSGLRVMYHSGLWDDLEPHARFRAATVAFSDHEGTLYLRRVRGHSGRGPVSPEVDRGALMEVLRGGVSRHQGKVAWGKKVVRVEAEDHDNNYRSRVWLHLSTGERDGPYDLVVGADGAWSRVRESVSDLRPKYAGYAGFVGKIVHASASIADAIGPGTHFAFRRGQKVTGHRRADGSLQVAVVLEKDEAWANSFAGSTDDAIRNAIVAELQATGWDDSFLTWVKATASWRPYPQYHLPPPPIAEELWPHRRGITLIGDAAHLLTTFGGKGVNIAFVDAFELTGEIIKALTIVDESGEVELSEVKHGRDEPVGLVSVCWSLDQCIRAFELSMSRRAAQTHAMTMLNQRCVSSTYAPVELLSVVLANAACGEIAAYESVLRRLQRTLVRTLAFAVFAGVRFWGAASRVVSARASRIRTGETHAIRKLRTDTSQPMHCPDRLATS